MAKNITPIIATRTSAWTYTITNDRGAQMTIGMDDADGAFSPVELLQAALAGCAALSAEAQLINKLGDDARISSTVEATYNPGDNRIETLVNSISAEMAELDSDRREKLLAATERSIEKLCTVKKSLKHGIQTSTTVEKRQ